MRNKIERKIPLDLKKFLGWSKGNKSKKKLYSVVCALDVYAEKKEDIGNLVGYFLEEFTEWYELTDIKEVREARNNKK